MDKSLDFKPRQILFLECGTERLYTELIQVVKERELCWVRPLFLADKSCEPHKITDLRSSSDLLWSINLFQPAMEVEVIPFFSDFAHEQELSEILVKQQLHYFIQKLWVQQSSLT